MKIDLSNTPTRAPKEVDKEETKQQTAKILNELNDLQNLLYADGKHSILIILQGMDASGKDGAIKKVFTYVNPQGISVTSFKVPDQKELAHDFLWRIHSNVPAKGMIKVFNRSQYEDILVTRVHELIDDDTAKQRMKAINDFEELISEHNQTTILKFYLHISRKEQSERLQERIENPQKKWKYNANDLKEAEKWDQYMKVYEDCFEHCNKIPWIIVPSDQNWYKEFVIAETVFNTLKSLPLVYPGIND